MQTTPATSSVWKVPKTKEKSSTERDDAAGRERADTKMPEHMQHANESYRMFVKSFQGLAIPSTPFTCTLFLFEMTASHLI